MSAKEPEELASHESIAEKFQELRSHNSQIAGRLNEISSELAVCNIGTVSFFTLY